jgi:hypothetical protein
MLTAPRQEIGAANGGITAAGLSWIPKDKRLKQSLFQNRNLCYHMFQAAKFGRRCRSGRRRTDRRHAFEMFRSQPRRRVEAGKNFFIWIRCNPLKSPDSTKENQGKCKPFFLVLFGFTRIHLEGDRLQVVLTRAEAALRIRSPLQRERVGVRVPRRAPLPSSGGLSPPPSPRGEGNAHYGAASAVSTSSTQ